jgi:hypothetical protein
METVKRSTRSAAAQAASRALDAEIDATLEGREPRYPNGTVFVGADIATPELIRRDQSEGKPMVIVDEHGNEQFLPAP